MKIKKKNLKTYFAARIIASTLNTGVRTVGIAYNSASIEHLEKVCPITRMFMSDISDILSVLEGFIDEGFINREMIMPFDYSLTADEKAHWDDFDCDQEIPKKRLIR